MIHERSLRYVTDRYHNTSLVETMLQQLKVEKMGGEIKLD